MENLSYHLINTNMWEITNKQLLEILAFQINIVGLCYLIFTILWNMYTACKVFKYDIKYKVLGYGTRFLRGLIYVIAAAILHIYLVISYIQIDFPKIPPTYDILFTIAHIFPYALLHRVNYYTFKRKYTNNGIQPKKIDM